MNHTIRNIILCQLLLVSISLQAQIAPGVYKAQQNLDSGKRNYLLLVSQDYMIHTIYDQDPANFQDTRGGFYSVEDDSLIIELEFNSNFEQDGERVHKATIKKINGNLVFNDNTQILYKPENSPEQALDGQWLFATRGPDTGQERRGEENPRKTLKYLQDGYFQWIAYHTETMQFSGTGGGRYTAEDGTYTEKIRFFSRDNSRVGAELQFQYEIEGDDWHHKGKNSKGEDMYEIWGRR